MATSSMKDESPLQKARDDFAEKISVAGWKEAVSEPIPLLRYTYRVSLIVFSIVSVYLLAIKFREYRNSGYTDEITDFATVGSIPMPNVTVCAQVYCNQTYIEEIVSIPESVLAELGLANQTTEESKKSLKEFYRLLTIFLSSIMRPRHYSAKDKISFRKVIAANPRLIDYGDLIARAVAPCEKMFKRCWFDGREFDCCSKATRSYDDDGICYIFRLNMDSDNAAPNERTTQQHRSGPAGGFTIEASLPLHDFPWFEDDAQNGFRIIVGHVPFSFASSPVLAPDLSETFVKVTPQLRNLAPAAGCAEHGIMEMPGGEFMYYDPEGLSCIMRELSKLAHKYAQCRVPTYLYMPQTHGCDPMVMLLMSIVMSNDLGNVIQETDKQHFALEASKSFQQFENELHATGADRSRCPRHCRYWTYDSTASFFYLDREHLPNQTMYSKIHVYYGELAYRQYEQVKELPIYRALCDLGNVFGLYWGMSVVSFAHVIYYVVVYVQAWRKWGVRKVGVQNIRTVRVTAV